MKEKVIIQKDTERKVLAYCRSNEMFREGDRVVLGVSGGADSICLLFVLFKLQHQLGITLHVVHVNHGVRKDAALDAEYVESQCRKLGIPFLLKEIQLAQLTKELGATPEEAGRMARYEAFDEACRRFQCNKIAVAHNSNDRAETMLFHLLRGTGLKGMAGILPVRDKVVRPLLCLERWEIEAYLEESGISYKQDSTNDTDDYTRNRIRHHILPYAEEHVAEGCVANMCRAADIFAQEESYLEEQTLAALQQCALEESGELEVDAFLKLHPVIRRRLILKVLKQLTPEQQDIAAVHVEDVCTLFTNPRNREFHLPYQIRGRRTYDKVSLKRISQGNEETSGENERIMKEVCDTLVPEFKNVGDEHRVMLSDGSQMTFKLLEKPKNLPEDQVFCENRYTKWFDYDKIGERLYVRTRQTGDYLTIRGKETPQHKTVKDYMVAEKIPRQERDRLWLLADGKHVLWLMGYRISEEYKVTVNTKRILKVQWEERKE